MAAPGSNGVSYTCPSVLSSWDNSGAACAAAPNWLGNRDCSNPLNYLPFGAGGCSIDVSGMLMYHDTGGGCLTLGVGAKPPAWSGWGVQVCFTIRTIDRVRIGEWDMLPLVNVAFGAFSIVFLIFIWRR